MYCKNQLNKNTKIDKKSNKKREISKKYYIFLLKAS